MPVRSQIIVMTDDFLPLSVRREAEKAALAVVDVWRHCTYEQWAKRTGCQVCGEGSNVA